MAHGPDPTFALGSCFAGIDTYTLTNTNPTAFVSGDQQINLTCSWQLDNGFVDLFAVSDRFGTFSDLFIVDGRNEYFGFAEPVLSTTSFVADYEVFENERRPGRNGIGIGDPDPNGRADLDPRPVWEFQVQRHGLGPRRGGQSDHRRREAFDDAADGRLQLFGQRRARAGDRPKTSGPKLKNDAPSGAIALAIGDKVEVRTGGTALEPEEPCTVEFDGKRSRCPSRTRRGGPSRAPAVT